MKQILTIIVCVGFVSCHGNKDNPIAAAKDYCDCMKKNGSPQNFDKAYPICKKELIKKYRLYKLSVVDQNDSLLSSRLPYETGDTIGKFMNDYEDYIRNNCCKVVNDCHPSQ